ncbi:MAG: class I SAM-dependent methyltransferase [Gammaproteobacteria bacterium]|nr:class I SAM-dependent methyltransferase [Gammaproteobacteria bacterium]
MAHLGVSPRHGVADCFTQPCRFTFVQETDAGADAVSRFDALPLPSDTFDVVVLHHALDFCQQPQRVLAEAARIIRPGGRIVPIGLSPYSLLGLGKWLLAPWHAAGSGATTVCAPPGSATGWFCWALGLIPGRRSAGPARYPGLG